MTLDAPRLAQACDCTVMRAQTWLGPLVRAAQAWGIDTPARQAAWLAQLAHESGRLANVREIWGPTVAQRGYEPPSETATKLGNTQRGDGYRFLGRGPIQITGRGNYAAFRDAAAQRLAGVRDFEGSPEMLEQPRWGAHAAGWYWSDRQLNDLADIGDFEALTRRINGGLTGYADRLRLWAGARRALAA